MWPMTGIVEPVDNSSGRIVSSGMEALLVLVSRDSWGPGYREGLERKGATQRLHFSGRGTNQLRDTRGVDI